MAKNHILPGVVNLLQNSKYVIPRGRKNSNYIGNIVKLNYIQTAKMVHDPYLTFFVRCIYMCFIIYMSMSMSINAIEGSAH